MLGAPKRWAKSRCCFNLRGAYSHCLRRCSSCRRRWRKRRLCENRRTGCKVAGPLQLRSWQLSEVSRNYSEVLQDGGETCRGNLPRNSPEILRSREKFSVPENFVSASENFRAVQGQQHYKSNPRTTPTPKAGFAWHHRHIYHTPRNCG